MKAMSENDIKKFSKLALDRAKTRWGYEGWQMLSPAMREDTAYAELLKIVSQWDEAERIPCTAVQQIFEVLNQALCSKGQCGE